MSREVRAFMISMATLIVVLLLLLGSYSQWHARPSEEVSDEVLDTLRTLGMKALESNDVPVGAVVIYGEQIIGSGHNKVQRDLSAGGHAEIEALSDAIRRLGFEHFQTLNRDSVILVTTFEPCLMCRGAILEYRIANVVFLKGKPVLSWIREDLRTLRFSWTRKQGGSPALQDSLFRKHPLYPQEP
jgi:tRNA(Arg) A34 adenosine deaminase TadA